MNIKFTQSKTVNRHHKEIFGYNAFNFLEANLKPKGIWVNFVTAIPNQQNGHQNVACSFKKNILSQYYCVWVYYATHVSSISKFLTLNSFYFSSICQKENFETLILSWINTTPRSVAGHMVLIVLCYRWHRTLLNERYD